MSEIRLFDLATGEAKEVPGEADGLEKSLQTLIERNLEIMLAVRFVASEHATGKVHGGRIDTLGLDEDGCPVILEYKRAISENVVSQGLYYLDWLLDHKAEFKLLVLDRFDRKAADAIDWSAPRLICVAADFTKFDEHAIRQINRNIDLIRYRRFGQDLLVLELATRVSAAVPDTTGTRKKKKAGKSKDDRTSADKSVTQALADMDENSRDLYEALRSFVVALGDDVTEKQMKHYVAFRRIKNFVTVCVLKKGLCLYLRLDPGTVDLDKSFMRDVKGIGHWGTGDLEVWVTDKASFKKAQPLILRSYEGT